MKRIGLLSDTHGSLPESLSSFFEECDEIWHAGDWGSPALCDHIRNMKPVRAVYGNIDGQEIRLMYPSLQVFTVEDLKVLLTHTGGYPGKYNPELRKIIEIEKPGLVIAGHSHILKVIYDPVCRHLFINPGAAGRYGWHTVITCIRFIIHKDQIKDLEIWEGERMKTKMTGF